MNQNQTINLPESSCTARSGHLSEVARGSGFLLEDTMPNKPTPNTINIKGEIAEMILTTRKGNIFTVFDTEDIPLVRKIHYRWHAFYEKRIDNYYVVSPGSKKGQRDGVRLARLVTKCPRGFVPHHINHDTLDNRKLNLRIVTQQVNLQNKKGAYKSSKTGIRGVYFHKITGKWYAQVDLSGKKVYQELFDKKEDAERAVKAARAYFYQKL